MMQRRILLALPAALAASALLSGCGLSGVRVEELPRRETKAGAKRIRQAILDTAGRLGYSVEADRRGAVTVVYKKLDRDRKPMQARYRIDYGEHWYQIHFLNSRGLSEARDEGGNRTAHRKVQQWQSQFDRHLMKELGAK
ncbi:hypothetical protein MAF45_04100 [Mesosutterella sp. OilRF-GAM-744-9]|uniref:Lipoprotein n=2 Tax=Mesosutterella TaxID=2494213 RepID=A0ABS9MPT9_9BURK|nr:MULTISPECIES: hypothetical protein [unclassified Mesosutterella]MCG5030628.1 hypothetical protein [Mesosutterella sp. oilRF-744-WT-GAM-9]MCI6529741.1 hypothetical protein [Mesosutterella sp.]MDL2060387.1 hypothetical protein [Mesosutterella sp. AGMB02718]